MTTPIFDLADRAIDELAVLDPIDATQMGVPGHDHELPDFGPEGIEARAEWARRTSAAAQALLAEAGPDASDSDRQAADIMVERLGNVVAMSEAGDYLRALNVLASPPQSIRMAIQLMPSDQDLVAERMAAVPAALSSWRAALTEGGMQGRTAAQRQVQAVADQLQLIGEGWFHGHVEGRFETASDHLRDLANQADRAYTRTAEWLEREYLPVARESDGVGEEDYRRLARAWLGEDIDLAETYAWGWEEFRTLRAEMDAEAEKIRPGAGLRATRDFLEVSPDHQIVGEANLVQHLRRVTAEGFAIAERHFDIDERLRECQVRIAPAGSAAAPYYTPPSEDLSRPGATWYPTQGKDRFPAWQLRSIWFHEAVPGHHLQLGTVLVEKDRLSRFQRLNGWTSGYGEGWALYAERLMDEVGGFDRPAVRLGFLSAQAMRAARVVVDLGLHLGLPIPEDNGLGIEAAEWTPALAVQVLVNEAMLSPEFAASEVDRYLGLPGQAISYKVGERVWLDERAKAQHRLGPDFDLTSWHMYALRAGHMGLGPFRAVMSRYQA